MFHGGYLAEALLVPEMWEFSLAAVLAKEEEDSHAGNAEEQEDEML